MKVTIDTEGGDIARINAALERMSFSTWACGSNACLKLAIEEIAKPRCSAHGDVECENCSRITTQFFSGGECTGCSTWGSDGMHWDTCPGRILGKVYANRDEAERGAL